MALTHALSTNNYGESHLIVATSAANGTHTTLAGAMADAVSGDTIFLRDSVTENVTLTAGVNIAAWNGETLNTPTITGTLTMTTAGTCNISGIRLVTNSAAFLAVTGSATSIVNLNNCYLNCLNNTGITFSTSDAGAKINVKDCRGDIGTTGIAIFTHTSAGTLNFNFTTLGNVGASTTANTASAGSLLLRFCQFSNPITTSGTSGAVITYSLCDTSPQNVTAFTCGGSGGNLATKSFFSSGSASAVSIGATLTMSLCDVNSSNTNAVTGAGTLANAGVSLTGTSQVINTTTQTKLNLDVGGVSFNGGTNNLQTYVEGSWTPGVAFGGAAVGITYSAQVGKYTQIGNVVYFMYSIALTSKGSSTGSATITGFPVTMVNSSTGRITMGSWTITMPGGGVNMHIRTDGSTTGGIFYNTSGAGATAITDVQFAASSTIAGEGFYYSS